MRDYLSPKHLGNRFYRAFALFFLLCFFHEYSCAEENKSIQLRGLTLSCEDCHLLESGDCSVVSGEGKVLGCDDFLIHSLAKDGYQTGFPSDKEMLQGLLDENFEGELLSALIVRLLSSEAGQNSFLLRRSELVALYSEDLSREVLRESIPQSFSLKLWELSDQGQKLTEDLRVAILVGTELSAESFISSLSYSPRRARAELKLARQTLETSSKRPEVLPAVSELELIFIRCSRKNSTRKKFGECIVNNAPDEPATLRDILSKRFTSPSDERAKVPDSLEFLISEFGLDESEELARRIVEKASKSKFSADRERVVRSDLLPRLKRVLLNNASANDKPLASLLVKSAEEAAIRGEVENTLGLLRESLVFYSPKFQERDKLLQELRSWAREKGSPELFEALNNLAETHQENLSKRERFALFAGFATFSVFVLWLAFAYYMKKRRDEYFIPLDDFDMLPPEEKYREKMRLQQYFNLPAQVTEEQLNKRYRNLASKLHPDKGGNKSEFSELQQKYQRAKRLFFNSK